MEIQKWEYKQFINDWSDEEFTIEQELNLLGDEGWELVSIVGHFFESKANPGTEKQKQTFYFKRPLQSPTTEFAFTSEPIGLQPPRY